MRASQFEMELENYLTKISALPLIYNNPVDLMAPPAPPNKTIYNWHLDDAFKIAAAMLYIAVAALVLFFAPTPMLIALILSVGCFAVVRQRITIDILESSNQSTSPVNLRASY